MSTTPAWHKFRNQVREIIIFLPLFLRRPIDQMKNPPDWDWSKILTLHALFGAAMGFLRGLVGLRFSSVIYNSVASTFSALLIGVAGSVLIYAFLMFYLNRQESWLRIYTVVALSSLPLLMLRILNAFDILESPAQLLGFALMCLLLTVSLVEVFRVPQKQVIRWMGGLFLIGFLFWAIVIVEKSKENADHGPQITPESMDILKKEFSRQ